MESELTDVKFSVVESIITKTQITQLSILIGRTMILLPDTGIES